MVYTYIPNCITCIVLLIPCIKDLTIIFFVTGILIKFLQLNNLNTIGLLPKKYNNFYKQ